MFPSLLSVYRGMRHWHGRCIFDKGSWGHCTARAFQLDRHISMRIILLACLLY